jgi:hypothetical protein
MSRMKDHAIDIEEASERGESMQINFRCPNDDCHHTWREDFDASEAQAAIDAGSHEHPHPDDVAAGVEYTRVCDDCRKITLAS